MLTVHFKNKEEFYEQIADGAPAEDHDGIF